MLRGLARGARRRSGAGAADIVCYQERIIPIRRLRTNNSNSIYAVSLIQGCSPRAGPLGVDVVVIHTAARTLLENRVAVHKQDVLPILLVSLSIAPLDGLSGLDCGSKQRPVGRGSSSRTRRG